MASLTLDGGPEALTPVPRDSGNGSSNNNNTTPRPGAGAHFLSEVDEEASPFHPRTNFYLCLSLGQVCARHCESS